MGYRVVGTLKHDDEVFDHGESVSASDVGGKENFEHLVATRAVVKDEEFKSLYPEQEGSVVQPSGTPSNLEPVEGTKLAASEPTAKEEEAQKKAPAPESKSPSDSKTPVVKSDEKKLDK